jgi:hypothetical protein
VVSIYHGLMRHQAEPGRVGSAPARLAPGDRGGPPGARTLLVFAHPRCPCTRATIRELERILARATVPVRSVVHLYRPLGETDDWVAGAIFEGARKLPRTEVRVDPEGTAARRFGALTSGYALLYGPSDELLFSGGVTPARGHEGGSPGQLALARLLREHVPAADHAPVFGCSIRGTDGEKAAGSQARGRDV